MKNRKKKKYVFLIWRVSKKDYQIPSHTLSHFVKSYHVQNLQEHISIVADYLHCQGQGCSKYTEDSISKKAWRSWEE